MDINERLEYAAELFCDEKYDESNHAFQRLLDEATDQDVSCIINDSDRKMGAKKFVAQVLFYAGDYQRAYAISEQISDYYENTEYNVLDLLMYNYVYANVTAALGMFDKAEKSVYNMMAISRQCTFAAASFLAYSANAFLAMKQGNTSEFERIRSLAMGYAAVGMDMREFEVVWLRNL